MTPTDLLNLANQYMNDGNRQMAVELWGKAIKEAEPIFMTVAAGVAAYTNLHNEAKARGDIKAANEILVRFLNCPLTGITIDSIPKVKQQIQEYQKQLNPPKEDKK